MEQAGESFNLDALLAQEGADYLKSLRGYYDSGTGASLEEAFAALEGGQAPSSSSSQSNYARLEKLIILKLLLEFRELGKKVPINLTHQFRGLSGYGLHKKVGTEPNKVGYWFQNEEARTAELQIRAAKLHARAVSFTILPAQAASLEAKVAASRAQIAVSEADEASKVSKTFGLFFEMDSSLQRANQYSFFIKIKGDEPPDFSPASPISFRAS
jgi:hypothetical protein